jgi:hypothetical protein
MSDCSLFYLYKHSFNNGVLYIGKGSRTRVNDFNNRSKYWKSLYKKHGINRIDVIVDGLTEDDAYELENLVISEYRDMGLVLCNLNDGGKGGLSGYKHSDEAKRNISLKQIGKFVNEDTRKKISEKAKIQFKEKGHPCINRVIPNETRFKISNSKKGKKESTESRINKSIGQLGRKHDDLVNQKKSEKLRDKSVYKLYSDKFGTVEGTRNYLLDNYGITSNAISALKSGRAKSQLGFILK